ncbi:MAG TPA: reverse transcriptase domain-containing protein [Solirubrobacteraceae bacterium]|nr:reverse transcriptase domain-containing protein [Solirubrobacteraceae bacterium]
MRIEREILREARRLIVRHETHGRLLAEEHSRRSRRASAAPATPRLARPPHWKLDRGFDPYLVRGSAGRIGHSIREALSNRSYRPRHPHAYEVPKPDGGVRTVCIYQVADSAVSKMLFDGVLKKNLPLMSARSYAYRSDLSAQNAIQYIKSEFAGRSRLYVAEYDFSKYFDTISHEHIRRVLYDHFLLTAVEREAIEAFLEVGFIRGSYSSLDGPKREVGVPQGTSISLFLANIAAWELDRALEGEGVRFVRYADDTLIWSTDYARLCSAVEILHSHAAAIGASVNAAKSPGIHLLLPTGVDGEIETVHHVDYLGHRMGIDCTQIKPAGQQRVMAHVDQLLFNTLLREPLRGNQNPARLSHGVDRDYVTVISRLRRYLYGDLSEKALRRYQTRGAPLRRFKGLMSAYPLVDDLAALARLDEWILTRLWLATRKRGRLLREAGAAELPVPHGLSAPQLRTLTAVSSRSGERIPLEVPSVQRIAGVIRDAAKHYGPARVGQPDVYEGYD